MANKQVKHSFQKGLNKDISKSLLPNEFYFHGQNIKIISTNTQSTGAVSNEKGNSLIITIPIPTINYGTKVISYNDKTLSYTTDEIDASYGISGTQVLIGHGLVRNNFILFTTDNSGFDCIWKVNDSNYDIELLYLRNLGFNTQNLIQVINNFENETIDKVYWVDGKHQTRFINIHHAIENQDIEELIDLSFNNIQFVGAFDLDQPKILDTIQGGIHTSGMIQYAYNLYKINGSQTKISPLTDLIPLNKGENNGGGDVNEIVGTVPIVKIDNLDQTYTNIKLYYVKYTAYNEIPEIALILDQSILDISEITYYDDGNIIENLSLEEFLFLGSDIIIPKHINSKKNIMFFANYKEKNFDVNTYNEVNSIDTRAFSFETDTITTNIYNSLYDNAGTLDSTEPAFVIDEDIIDGINTVPYKNSSININYDLYNKQFNSDIIGGEGAYLKYEIVRNQVGDVDFTLEETNGKFLKDNEIYRLGIEFYNLYGQTSLPKWIADFKTIVVDDESNLNGYYASLKIILKPLFYTWLADDNNFLDEDGIFDESLRPVGYRLIRSERTLLDRTIVCQGLINGMLSQVVGDDSGDDEEDPLEVDYINRVNNGVKIPSMIRRFDEYLCPMWGNESYKRVDRFDEAHPEFINNTLPGSVNNDAGNEAYKAEESGQWTAGTYQFNKLMQLFSPEITFNILQNLGVSNLKLIGGLENNYNAAWSQAREVSTKTIINEGKIYNAIYPHDIKTATPGNFELLNGEKDNLQFHGFFGHGQENEMNFVQTFRQYTNTFNSIIPITYATYGTPDVVELGQGRTIYNNNPDMVYYNTIEPLSTDVILNSVNSWGAKNITFALENVEIDTVDRIGLEDVFTDSGLVDTGNGLIAEFTIPELLVYLGNIYGGNTYEAKKRSNYIEIGDYKPISENTYNCIHFGDTFVSNFKFTKLVKTNTEIYSRNSEQLTEIVEFRVETTVDLKNRNDLSINEWDIRFQPKDEEYQKYNRVYSQEPTLILRRDLDYKFKRINSFDTNVISSKVKIPGEIIDSWTDLQPNNTITLNGKYGAINSLHEFNEELYTLQDSAVAFLSIQPRVQINGNDGLEVELGSGKVLQEYRYVSTDSGTKNKWSVVSSPQAFYYFDIINKSINMFKQGISGLTDQKGLHTYMSNEIQVNSLITDNPILKQGVSASYDFINNCVFFTFLQDTNSTTLSYNELIEAFESFHDYIPSMYISRGNNFLALNPNNTQLFKQYAGNYNQFFNTYYPSYITLLVNPESDMDTILDNVKYKSELYLNGVDQPNRTLTHVQTYNEYQNSNLTPLIFARDKNLRRKFRDWNIILPRNNNTRQRIRNPWTYLKLQYEHNNNYQLILHNPIISYTI